MNRHVKYVPNAIIMEMHRFQEKPEETYLIQPGVGTRGSKGMWRGQGTFPREDS